MDDATLSKINAVDWGAHSHPCGFDQRLVPGLLNQLVQGDEAEACRAATDLWNIAAHQGNVGSSAVPILSIVMELMPRLSEQVQVELLDTLYQFVLVAERSPRLSRPTDDSVLDWRASLGAHFGTYREQFLVLKQSENEDVAGFAEMIIAELDQIGEPEELIGG